ncbi:hypothetical protein [Streptomyces iranensis]|uniref:hypothetical protein n=1 Tax=Streptomyces iranensis TaxID=576784 RepID=UPI0039B73CF6
MPRLSTDSDRVIRVNSFSKTLGPGLRLGRIVGPPWLLPAVTRPRANQDQHSSTFTQAIATRLLTTPGLFDRVTADARALYGRRTRALPGGTGSPGRIRLGIGAVAEHDVATAVGRLAEAPNPETAR